MDAVTRWPPVHGGSDRGQTVRRRMSAEPRLTAARLSVIEASAARVGYATHGRRGDAIGHATATVRLHDDTHSDVIRPRRHGDAAFATSFDRDRSPGTAMPAGHVPAWRRNAGAADLNHRTLNDSLPHARDGLARAYA